MKKMRKTFLLVLASGCIVGCSYAESLAVLLKRTDWSCVKFKVLGVCRRTTPPYVGIKVRYWQPVLLMETVKRPGDTVINELRTLVKKLSRRNSDACSSSQSDGSVLQMNEAHVFGFPFSDAFSELVAAPCEGAPDLTGVVSYLSELDAHEWRTAEMEAKHPLSRLTARLAPLCDGIGAIVPGLCLGNWGPLYPRQGFLAHYSPLVGSAVAVYRAIDIASFNFLSPHRTLAPILFMPNMGYDRMQLVYPKASRCIKVGEPAVLWENGRVSKDGKYAWIYWRMKQCCLF